jgi:hypothetical protein
MGGGLMQLVAYGAQDIYLTGNPQITFFKVVYRRHTNFSMEAIEQTFNGTVNYASRATSTISRNGDLVSKMYVEFDPTAAVGTTATAVAPYLGNGILKEVSIEIGGQLIDKHYSHWLSTWADLTEPNPTGACGGYSDKWNVDNSNSLGRPTMYQRTSFNGKQNVSTDEPTKIHTASVPLQFWFCRNPGLALPLIALQYHEVKIIVEFETAANLTNGTGASLSGAKLWVDYIYLDTDERRRFAQVSHEYLIEQLQHSSFPASSGGLTCELNFNHPVKELIWSGRSNGRALSTHGGIGNLNCRLQNTDGTDLADNSQALGGTIGLKLNGHDRFTPRHHNYFSQTQVLQHHTGCNGAANMNSLCVYSFALKPEEHQPSGTCNFSRIDNAQLIFTSPSGIMGAVSGDGVNVYAVNYNVLRIMSGMGGLAYSN